MSIKTNMSLLLAPLIAGLTFFSISDLVVKNQEIQNAEYVLSSVQFLEHASAAVHELQKERGASVALLSGDSSFRDKVNAQRQQSDTALKVLTAFINSEMSQKLDPALKGLYERFDADLKARPDWQQRINVGSAGTQQVVGYYSGLIKALQTTIPTVVANNSEPELSPLLIATQALLEMKELAGVERAIVSGTLASGSVTDAALARIAGLRDGQALYLAQLQLYTPKAVLASLEPLLNQTVGAQVEAIRQQVLVRTVSTAAADWFRLATERIDSLKQADELLEKAVMNMATEIRDQASVGFTRSLLVMFGLLIFNSTIGFFFIRSLSRIEKGLGVLADNMTAAARNKDLSVKVYYPFKDDVGQVTQAFNQMMYDFCGLIDQIRDISVQLATAAEETSTTASSSATELEVQMGHTLSVTAAMEELSASVAEVSTQMKSVDSTVRQVHKESTNAQAAVSTSVADIHRLSDEITRINEGILELSTSSERITEVVSVIRTIAGQTNLLALNAAIEAARAGEAGRGFAVVADEVRGLAQRTQESTVEIEEMVSVLQSSVTNTSNMINSSQGMAAHSVELSSKVSDALGAIFGAVDETQNLSNQIAATTQQQAAVSSDVAKSATSISSSAEFTVVHAKQIASVSEEVSKLASKMTQAAGSFKTF